MRGFRTLGRALVGPALSRQQATSEKITPVEGLSALSLDALTSVAYGPEAILIVLAAAGAGALHLILPITIAIVVLLAVLVVSYRQVIDAYPQGGGAYAVSRDNFGRPGQPVGRGRPDRRLHADGGRLHRRRGGRLHLGLSVTVHYTVEMCLGILLVITALNLRGLGESARAFLLPTFVFIVGLLAIIAIGLIHPLGRDAPLLGTSLVSSHRSRRCRSSLF